MVGATRGTPEGFRSDQASGSQQPPLPPPNLAKVMARQTELLNMLVQAQQHQFRSPQRGCEEYPSAGYQDFFSTQPPLFIRLKNPWMQMHGSVPSSPSLHYSRVRVPKRIKLSSQPNSSVGMLAFGGTTTMPCNQMDMSSIGKNFRQPLERIIS
jgi:hypothetical protein